MSSIKVVILSFNHPGITKKCIESALNYFKPQDLFLVHNGSSFEFVKSLKTEFSEINHLEIPQNKGFTGGANFGICKAFENSDCEAVLFLSNDTKLEKFKFEAPENKKYFLAPIVELRETGRTHSFGGSINFFTGTLSHLETQSLVTQNFYVPGAAFIISRAGWALAKGFDETLGSYWEDVDLSFRAKKLDIEVGRTQNIVVKHAVSKTTGGDPFYTVFLFHRNRRRVTIRHGRNFERFAFAFVYMTSTLRKLFKYSKNKDIFRLKMCLKASFLW